MQIHRLFHWFKGGLLLAALAGCQPSAAPGPLATLSIPTATPPPTPALFPSPTPQPPAQPHPILGDIRVRQAIAHCTNRAELIAAIYPWLNDGGLIAMDSFVPHQHWAYAGDDPAFVRHPFDPQRGQGLLDEAGWRLAGPEPYRANAAGETLTLTLKTTDAALRQTWTAVFEAQMKTCGVQVRRDHQPAQQFFAEDGDLQRRQFDLAAYAWAFAHDPGGRTQYLCDQIPASQNGWRGQNFAAWCSEAADAAIRLATSSLSQETRRGAYRQFQIAFTRDLPSLPLFARLNLSAANPALENFAPSGVFTWNAARWMIPGKDTIVLGEASEPASLFVLETSFVSEVIRALVLGADYATNDNYAYVPVMLKQLPSPENGSVSIKFVAVNEGDSIVDAAGAPTVLGPGVWLRDSDGHETEFAGGPAQLPQLTVRYEFVEGLKWSDGTPVSRADYELAYRIVCDPQTGEAEFFEPLPACGKIARVDFVSDTEYSVTWLPGYQDALYFLPPFSRQPAHQIIEGRRLADIPASQWLSLPEVRSRPLGVGPYVVKEWVYGQHIVFSANPHYYAGPPATPNLIVRFLEPAQALAALRSGEIDILGWDSIPPDQAEAYLQAQAEGSVRLFIAPSTSYEHIDFSLSVP